MRLPPGLFLIPLALCLATSPSSPEALTLLHTNDTHGHLLPFSYPSRSTGDSDLDGLSQRTNIGGIARRAEQAKRIREEQRQRGIPVWMVDGGDICDGTPFSTEYHGEADVAAMNAAGYNFATLGNHEFNNTLDQLKRLVGMASYKILCANATETATGRTLCTPYTIENVGPVRVAFFGLVTHESSTYPAAKEGVRIQDEIEAARPLVSTLKPKADIVVLISHCGLDMDEKIAQAIPEIDVIIGGHSHSRLPSGELIWRSEDLRSESVNGTIIVQAHQWGGELGRLDLHFGKDANGVWHVDRYRERLIPITADLEPDPAVAAVVDQYWAPIAARYGEVIGHAAADFAGRGDDRAEYNLVADAIRETFGTDFEFENLGGVRSPLIKGEITAGDISTLDPFNNTIVTFKATGREIKSIVQLHAPAVSGLRYRLEDGVLTQILLDGRPLADDSVYTGAANSYFAGFALKDLQVQDSSRPRREVILDYIRRKGTVSPSYDGRRVVMGGR